MNIQLHIERLVLDGLPLTRREGALVQTAVETELARLLGAEGLSPVLAGGGMTPSLAAPSVSFTPGGDPATLGMQIAHSVYGSFGR